MTRAAFLFLAGCVLSVPMRCDARSLYYLYQAARGQLALMTNGQPLERALRDESLSSRTRGLLAEIPAIKAHGEARGLKATRNYERFVSLERDAVVQVVVASRPLAFEARKWSFPLVGSFTYLGWFKLADAREHAAELRAEGWDVHVRGASAYSTLGWFHDPILSTMLGPRTGADNAAEGRLANVVLHESVHATAYVNGQSTFNESLASFVADRMVLDYLDARHGVGSPQRGAYEERVRAGEAREGRMRAAYRELDALYKSGTPDDDKRARKAAVIAALKADLKIPTAADINNATLIQYKTYDTGADAFADALRACGGDWRRFIAAMAAARDEDFSAPQTEDIAPAIAAAAARGCVPS